MKILRWLLGVLKSFGESLEESDKAWERHRMPYHEYLKSDYWKEKAKAVRHRDKYTCQRCGKTGIMLDVHHLTYERRGFERLEDLITLCRDCHREEHKK